MKKLTAMLLALVMALSVLTIPAAAESEVGESDEIIRNINTGALPHNSPYKHPNLMVIGIDETVETEKLNGRKPMSEAQMQELAKAALEDPEDTLIPEDCRGTMSYLSYVETRGIVSEKFPYFISFHVWGGERHPILVFFCPEGSEEWTLVACRMGPDIQVDLEEVGLYAVAMGW